MFNFLRAKSAPSLPKQLNFCFEQLENRILLAGDLRAIDGFENNETNPDWGSTGSPFLRITPAAYVDGISAPAGESRLSAREVSNIVSDQSEGPIRADRFHTDYVWQWGQFIAHDIALTPTADPVEPFFIQVPEGDVRFDPDGTGTVIIPSFRSAFDPTTGTDPTNPRQQTNATTAYIDASMVYGSNSVRATELRTFVDGKLKTSAGDLLPFNIAGLPNDDLGMPAEEFFLAGDPRANENIGLTAMHTLFVREHNRLADEIAAADPSLTDEEIYQEARRIVAAEVQVITYNEFLPALMGVNPLDLYDGYDPSTNAGISNFFTTAAFRVGHTMVNGGYLRRDENNQQIPDGDTNLAKATFNPQIVVDEGGLDPILRGLATQKGQEVDVKVRHQLRHFLFATEGQEFSGLDLAALNIQRGRDHGLPDYNTARVAFGLDPVASFAEITSDPLIQARLAEAYGDVNDIDSWIGGLAEDHLPGSSVGELINEVLYDQFTRLRDGDRFWYELDFAGDQLEELENTTLAEIILRNTGIQPNEPVSLQDNVFFQRRRQPAGLDAGLDQMVALDTSIVLDGTLIDPNNSGPDFTVTGWTVVAGPGGVAFGDASSIDTTATFDTVGTYVLRLGATDGVLDVTDDIAITVPSADFDSDGFTTGLDFLLWQRGFGIPMPNAVKTDGDADNDLDVDGDDLSAWESQFGQAAPLVAASSSPEVETVYPRQSLEAHEVATSVSLNSAEGIGTSNEQVPTEADVAPAALSAVAGPLAITEEPKPTFEQLTTANIAASFNNLPAHVKSLLSNPGLRLSTRANATTQLISPATRIGEFRDLAFSDPSDFSDSLTNEQDDMVRDLAVRAEGGRPTNPSQAVDDLFSILAEEVLFTGLLLPW